MKYHFKIYKENDGSFWAECLELEGCSTQGNTMEELRENMEEALNLYLDEPAGSDAVFALPNYSIRKSKNVVQVMADPQLGLAVLLKFWRREHRYSQKEMAEKLKMKNIYSYQRLEKRGDPKLSTLFKIKEIFPEIPLEMIFRD